MFTPVHKITLKTVFLEERRNIQSGSLANCVTCLLPIIFTSIRRAIGRWICTKKQDYLLKINYRI